MKTKSGGKKVIWTVAAVVVATVCGCLTVHIGRGYPKVLLHYIFADFNLEKLRSAVFLIDNLDFHNTEMTEGSLTAAQQSFKARTDSVCNALCAKYGWRNVPMDSVFAERKASALWVERNLEDNATEQSALQPCRKTVTSGFLIRQIDQAYRVWKTSPFAKDLSFDEYKESILPFVCIGNYGELHSLDDYRNAVPVLSGLEDKKTLRERVAFYSKVLMYLRDINSPVGKKSFKGLLSMYSRDENCLDIAHYACMTMRAFGMPVAVDHVVGFRELADKHYFCSVYDAASERWQGFNPEGSLPGDGGFLGTPALNVYRDMFGAQMDAPCFVRTKDEYVPYDLSSPCLRDVTGHYFPTVRITLPFNVSTSNNLAYLSAFNCRGQEGLVASTWGKVNKGRHSVTFSNVLADVLYFPTYYRGEIPVCFGKPFYVKIRNGNPQICFLPSMDAATAKTELLLLRKYPVKKNMRLLAGHLRGSVILGSNDKTFAKADTLMRLAVAPAQYLTTYRLDRIGSYRYYRFLPPPEYPHADIAHMEWLVPRHTKDRETFPASREGITDPLQGHGKTTSRYCQLRDAVLKDMESSPQYDHNPLTSAGGYPHFTLHLSKPRAVEAVNLMPMHANNTITPGHCYLLLYWDNRWKICGKATAKYEYVEFRDVPSGKLYWLCDTTAGQEEMPFMISEGKQLFLYGDIIK